MPGPISVDFGVMFQYGAFATGAVEPVRDFEKLTRDRFVQATDKASGLPLWSVDVIDADPQARPKMTTVKVAAQVQPVLPSASAGSPFTAIELEGLQVVAYVDRGRCQGNGKCAARLEYSLKATGIRAPGRPTARAGREVAADAA
jgi:hypothetical protein